MREMRIDPLDRAVAAARHARLLMFRERTIEAVGDELHGLSMLTGPDEVEAVYEAAVELLAMLDPDDLERCVARVRYQRAIELERSQTPDALATARRSR